MTFRNPILGAGGSTLLRPAIQSPNYVAGSAGWAVKRDGSAEFNNIVIRGGTVESGTALYYDGTPAAGNLIMSIAASAGVDEFGNAYAAGLTLYSADGTINFDGTASTWNATPSGAGIQILVGGGSVSQSFAPSVVSGVTWDDGGIGANLASRLGTNTPQTFLSSPNNSASSGQHADISLYGAPQTSNGDVLTEAIIDAARTWVNSNIGWINGAWIKQAETWHTPTFSGTWSSTGTLNGNSTFRGLQYRKDAEDNVWILGGATTTGAGGSIFTLPSGYFNSSRRTLLPCYIFDSSAAAVVGGFAQVTETGIVNISATLSGVTIAAGDQVFINGKFPLGNVT